MDRYKFLDLYPCSSVELKSIGYTEVNFLFVIIMLQLIFIIKQNLGITANKSNSIAAVDEPDDDKQVQLPRPDFSQMIPYKPKANAYPHEHPLAGGTFPQPPALAALCAQLPPPVSFRGPFVSIELLFDIFDRIKLPDGIGFLHFCVIITFTYI